MFKTIFSKIRDLFCYCGLKKEEYESVKIDAYVSNFIQWKYIHIVALLISAVSILFARYEFNYLGRIFAVINLLYFVTVTVLFWFVLKKESIGSQLLIYLSMIFLLLFGYSRDLGTASDIAVTFEVTLILISVFMIDKPYYMMILLFSASGVYLASAYHIKTPEIFIQDLENTLIYSTLGIIINVFYNYIRLKEFWLKKAEDTNVKKLLSAQSTTNHLNSTLRNMTENIVDILGDIVESRDVESGEHIQRVKGYTYILANEIKNRYPEYGLDEYKVNLITYASALHDVGKISIPDSILLKPGKLTHNEYELMKTHCEKGCQVVAKMKDSWSKEYLEMGLSICLNHHEKWDGMGYPHGLKGDKIPIEAQIVSLADVYDALTTKRIYKDAYSFDKAYEMILNGECGAFSEKLITCFKFCKLQFEQYAYNPSVLHLPDFELEVSKKNTGFVVGLYDSDKTLKEKNRLVEEVSVMESLAENFLYVCYVNMTDNTVTRYKADNILQGIINTIEPSLPSNLRFDALLNKIIHPDDYEAFREITKREDATEKIRINGHLSVNFRIIINNEIHYAKMKLSFDKNDPNNAIIGISLRDEEHTKEQEYVNLEQKLENAQKEIRNRIILEDRLAVINYISSEYDYVCTLDAVTMSVTVYRANDRLKKLFKNVEDIIMSPEARNTVLKPIIHPDDFEEFCKNSLHENVMKNLSEKGVYTVSYRAIENGKLVNYQSRYAIDPQNPRRIIIGLHETK